MICDHQWTNTPGRPLACGDCGELWPGDPSWPPEPYMSFSPGVGDMRGVSTVRDMINQLREIPYAAA